MFWRKLMLFLVPFALIVVLVNGGLMYLGESMPLAWVVAQQQRAEALYRPQYGNRDPQFKALSIEARRPEVIAVGSSRVLQMRAGLLTRRPDAFYNAGAPAWQLDQVDALLRGLSAEALPRVIIMGVDPVWFNADYVPQPLDPPASDFAQIFAVSRSVVQEAITGPRRYDWRALLDRREPESGGLALGLRAIADGHGFRSDGSEQYGDFLVAGYLWQPRERERHLEWLRDGVDMYTPTAAPWEAKLAQLDALLAYLRGQGVTVIGFAPPFAPAQVAAIQSGGQLPYLDALAGRLQGLFTAHGFAYLDFADSRALGVSDDDFFDGWHGSERVYLRLFVRMVEALPDTLGAYADSGALRSIDAGVTDTFRVF
jgi:hypothetical protein